MKSKTFKEKTFRLYHSIRGYFMLKKFKHGHYYHTRHFPNTRFYYNKGNEFYEAFSAVVCPGVAYQDQRRKVFKNWEVSILGLREG